MNTNTTMDTGTQLSSELRDLPIPVKNTILELIDIVGENFPVSYLPKLHITDVWIAEKVDAITKTAYRDTIIKQ